MKLRKVLVGTALLLVGCVQRDNPFDPVNLPSQQPKPDSNAWIPVPDEANLVLLPESTSRNSPYIGNIQNAFNSVLGGSTLWIRGGEKIWVINGKLRLVNGGSERLPVVVRSFGGQAVIRYNPLDGNVDSMCLEIQQPYVKIVGVTFVNCETAIFAGFKGRLTLDSVRLVNSSLALDLQNVKGLVTLRHVQLTGTVRDPPFLLPPADSLDTLDFSWTPRTGS